MQARAVASCQRVAVCNAHSRTRTATIRCVIARSGAPRRFREDAFLPESAELHRSIDWDDLSPQEARDMEHVVKLTAALRSVTVAHQPKEVVEENLEEDPWGPNQLRSCHRFSEDFEPQGPELYRSRDDADDWE